MSRRTKCFTYGETRTSTISMNGALVTLAEYKSACGSWSEEASADPPKRYAKRPNGVCVKCWVAWRQDVQAAVGAP